MPRAEQVVTEQSIQVDERLIREIALDETIAQTFPASDPLSTNPNPDARELVEELMDEAAPPSPS